jgi:hypothetical protein
VAPVIQAVGRVSDATDLALRAGAFFLGAPQKDGLATTIAVELDATADKAERRVDVLIEARAVGRGEAVHDSAQVTIPPGGHAAVATRELHLPPGLWQARVVVRDAQTEKLGSVLHTFEVPAATGLRLSSPVLSDALESPRVPRPRLRLDRRYRPGDVLYCQYRVFGAAPDKATGKPRVRGSFSVVRDGQVVQEDAPTAIEPTDDGQVMRLLGFRLAGFAPGDYSLVLGVADETTGERRETREAFTVLGSDK